MSAQFKIAKKQYTQNDLRRLMQEQKSKTKRPIPESKVDSPLAKYNDLGQLTCVLCKSIVRSESVWKVHINTKVHKENIEAAKQLKEKLHQKTTSPSKLLPHSQKRPATIESRNNLNLEEIPEKRIKTSKEENSKTIPEDFFDKNATDKTYFEITLNKTSIKKDLVHIKRDQQNKNDLSETIIYEKMDTSENENELLPEGFFDDPVKDAKVRNLDYRDPQEEEWERFQREIKEESTVSNAIIADEQEEATADRQIEEIDEQIQNWSRVLNLEKKKEFVSAKVKEKLNKMDEDTDTDSNDENIDDIDELLDWRAKRLQRTK